MQKKGQHFLKTHIAGMTLVELLVVVSIIAMLTVLGLAYFRSQVFKGKDARRKGDLHEIQIALEEYEKDNDCYPLPQLVICKPGTGLKPYVSKIPCDPTTRASYFYEHENSACPQWYKIYAALENENDPDYIVGGVGPQLAYDYYVSSPNAPLPESGGEENGGNGEGGGLPDEFYGCIGGACTPILWDPERPGPECDPNYGNPSCYNQCGPPENECQSWGE